MEKEKEKEKEKERVGKDKGEAIAAAAAARDDNNNNDGSLLAQVKGGGQGPTSNKSKSCKGCLYYSSNLKSDSRNPLCVGISRSLPQVPRYTVGESELEASKVGRRFTGFKYGCVGYSIYSDTKGQSKDMQDTQSELPVCVGIEVRRLEAQGVPSKQAEAITSSITEVLNDTLENVAQSFVSKAEMQKVEMTQEANLAKFKSEVTSSQGHHFSMLQHETEKLKGDIEKMRSELRYEIDKVTAGQRLDLNLERGRIRDELSNQGQETSNLTNKLDREIHALRAQVEAAKYDVIKYCIGTLVSISAVGLAVLRILM